MLLIIRAAGAAAAEEATWILLPEPRFMGHQVTQPIAGAKSTVLAVGRITEEGPNFARSETWKMLGISDEQVLAATRKQAATWLQGMEPRLVRDRRKVVEYGVLESENVPVAATVLAPEFWTRFEGVFGPKMRVVIPNRQTVYIFPDLVGDLQTYTPMVMQAWRSRHPKVSLEVFEVTEKGLRAIGIFEEP
jgi:hypothetical protein